MPNLLIGRLLGQVVVARETIRDQMSVVIYLLLTVACFAALGGLLNLGLK
jgi:hypothetical protein